MADVKMEMARLAAVCDTCSEQIDEESQERRLQGMEIAKATSKKPAVWRHLLCHSTLRGLDRAATRRGERFQAWWKSLKSEDADKHRDIVLANIQRRRSSDQAKRGVEDMWDFDEVQESSSAGTAVRRIKDMLLMTESEFLNFHTSAKRRKKQMTEEEAMDAWNDIASGRNKEPWLKTKKAKHTKNKKKEKRTKKRTYTQSSIPTASVWWQ